MHSARALLSSRHALSSLQRTAPRSALLSARRSPTALSQHSALLTRAFSIQPPPEPKPATKSRRSLLYVPGSNPKMLRKSTDSASDALIFDLEDSVAHAEKGRARNNVFDALQAASTDKALFVRINSGAAGGDDLELVLKSSHLDGIVIPKVNSAADVRFVDQLIDKHSQGEKEIKIIASIESPLAVLNLREIATASPRVDSLLFAAEDFCASAGLVRTTHRLEMLYARSAVVTHARAYGLQAIDLVCVNYQDLDALKAESREGHELGFTGKQAIHPGQVKTISEAFTPNAKEIQRAVDILAQYEIASSKGAGAYGLTDSAGSTAMIDAPMLLQANNIIAQATAAGVELPEPTKKDE